MGEIPHLKTAVSRFKDKPFEILAVSCDDDRTALTNLLKLREPPGIQTWHKKGPANPAAELYNVQGYPTWYLVDAGGVIRARDAFGDALIPAVEKAMQATRVGMKDSSGAVGGTK